MGWKTLDDMELAGKRVLTRVDINVPMQDGQVTDATRIEKIAPTVRGILAAGGTPILLAHFGRPKGERVDGMSLRHLVPALEHHVGFLIEADDATKLGNLDETLSIVNTNRYLSIESRALPQAGEEVPFYLNQYRHQAYVFRIHLNEVNGVTAYLVDDYLGTQTEMINNQENSGQS